MNRRGLFARLAGLIVTPLVAKIPIADAEPILGAVAPPALPVPTVPFIGGWWAYPTYTITSPITRPIVMTTSNTITTSGVNPYQTINWQRPPDADGALVA